MFKKSIFHILCLIILCSFLFFYKLGSLSLLDPDEPRYAEVAREMLETRNFLIPHFNYELRLNKPPLYYWLICLSYFIWGVNEFAVRFPSAIFALGGVIITFLLGYELYSSLLTGLLAGLILAVSWEYLIIARVAIIDMVLSFFVLNTILFFVKFLKDKKRIYLYLMWISTAFAFLSKGPVGLIPILVFLFFCLFDKKMNLFREIFCIPGLLIFLALSLSWYILVILRLGFNEALILFREETVERLVKGYIHNEPFFYYLPVIFAGFMPWSVFLPWINPVRKGGALNPALSGNKEAGLYSSPPQGAEFSNGVKINYKKEKFLVIWILVVFLFFSLSRSKLATYILGLFPALSLILANFWQEAFLERVRNLRTRITFSLLLFLSIIAISFFWTKGFVLREYSINIGKDISHTFIATTAVISISLYFCFKKNIRAVFMSLFILPVIVIVLFCRLFSHPLGQYRSTKDLIQPIKTKIKPADNIVAYNFKKPSLVFYSQHKVIFLKEMPYLLDYLAKGKDRLYLIIKETDFSEIKDKYNFYIENEHRGYVIVSRDGLSP